MVDDEQDICEILQYNLEQEGYEVATANSAEEALELDLTGYDLLLLDVMMCGMSGFDLARQLKKDPETAGIPIIFATALDDEEHTVGGLNLGADDYIPKPLGMKEVKARVAAVLRRTASRQKQGKPPKDNPSELTYDGLKLDMGAKMAKLDDVPLQLTKLEFELLTLFLQHPNKVFGRNDLLERCWPGDVLVLDRTVDVNITRLRKKIGRHGKQIKTRVGYGYYFED